MKKSIFSLAFSTALVAAQAQFQVNPQMGLTFQNLTDAPENTSFKAAAGWQLGTDLRFGDRLFFQPGAFFGRNATVVSVDNGETAMLEDNLVRTNLKLRAMVGYRIVDSYQFDLRFFAGPIVERMHHDITYTDSAGDVPAGEYVVMTFVSRFALSERVFEKLTLMLGEDDQWQVVGYFLKQA